jgi:hypothetical protein
MGPTALRAAGAARHRGGDDLPTAGTARRQEATMNPHGTRQSHNANPERVPASRSRRAVKRLPTDAWNLRFESVDAHIPAAAVARSPTLLMVAVEDVCWQVAMDTCRADRPRRWHRHAYAAWTAQARRLEDKRDRLRDLVNDELLAW